MRFINILILLLSPVLYLAAQESIVENVRVSQENNRIFIIYDLKTNLNISLVVLENGTEKFGFKMIGDVGYTEAGNSKKIILIPENETMVCQGCIFRVSGNLIPEPVRIGQQVWQAINLNVSKFMNGDDIPEAKTDEEWKMAAEGKRPAFCYYDNDPKNGAIYGKLYNWFAVNDPRGLAPKGFHIPSNAEWTILTGYLGGEGVAGTKMKSASGWSENGNGTNSSSFSGLPGGARNGDGPFVSIGRIGYWWSSTEFNTFAWSRALYCSYGNVGFSYGTKRNGFSVRCLRD
jgi:uncharacterized protein (TIGR02145 family)